MGRSIFNEYDYNNQQSQFTQPNQLNQFSQFTQPHKPTSMMDLLDEFNTFRQEYARIYGNIDPKTFATQLMQSGQISQDTLSKVQQVANMLRNFVH